MVLAHRPRPKAAVGVKFEGPALELPDLRNVESLRLDFNSLGEVLRRARGELTRGINSNRRDIKRWEREIESGRREDAEVEVQRAFGTGVTVEETIARYEAEIDECYAGLSEIDEELWQAIDPSGGTLEERRDRNEAVHNEFAKERATEGKTTLPFEWSSREGLRQELWMRLSAQALSSSWFPESEDLVIAMWRALDAEGMYELDRAIESGSFAEARQLAAYVTEAERTRARKQKRDFYVPLIVTQRADGSLALGCRELSLPEYRQEQAGQTKWVPPTRQRTCARQRASRSRSSPIRGSRRVASRSAGGGSSGDDPDPEPLARMGVHGLAEDHTLWDIAVTSFGAMIGDAVMGLEGMLVGGVVAYLWGRCHCLEKDSLY